jgi:hypothetical protein
MLDKVDHLREVVLHAINVEHIIFIIDVTEFDANSIVAAA